MKHYLLINFLFLPAIMNAMHPESTRSKPLSIRGKEIESDFRSLTTSKSPGDWACARASLDLRANQELLEAREQGQRAARSDSLAIEITSFIAHESIVLIKGIIDKKFESSIYMGDPKIDEFLKNELKLNRNESKHEYIAQATFDPRRETSTTYRIRTDPVLSFKMDRHALRLALLVNRIIRFSESESK